MQGKTHLAVGALLGVYLVGAFSFDTGVVALTILGALFPDIDTPTSLLGRKAKLVGWVFSHRGFFHSILAIGLVSWLSVSLFGFAGIGFLVGALSHLVLDMLNPAGVKIHPLPWKIRGPIKSGGVIDYGIFLFSAVICGLFILRIVF